MNRGDHTTAAGRTIARRADLHRDIGAEIRQETATLMAGVIAHQGIDAARGLMAVCMDLAQEIHAESERRANGSWA